MFAHVLTQTTPTPSNFKETPYVLKACGKPWGRQLIKMFHKYVIKNSKKSSRNMQRVMDKRANERQINNWPCDNWQKILLQS